MTLWSSTFTLPDMRFQVDIDDVKNAVLTAPGSEDVEADLASHTIKVRCVSPDAFLMVHRHLVDAGFPPIEA